MTTEGIKQLPELLKNFDAFKGKMQKFEETTLQKFKKSELQLDECYKNLDISHAKTIRERGDMQVTCQKFMRFLSELKFYDMQHTHRIKIISDKIN